MKAFTNFEAWVWTELLAFDHDEPDCGVATYLAELGYVPQAMCLLVSSPDFILNYEGMATEQVLPPDVCSRNAQPGNERRRRQEWTNFQLRRLIGALSAAGCEVYCSCFAVFLDNRYHHEWLSEHPEVRLCWVDDWRGQELNALAQMADGTLFEDFFIPKLIRVCRDYGFAGWHGPDGWGPWSSGNITGVDFSDATVGQFFHGRDWVLPECFAPIPRVVTQQEVAEARNAGITEPDWGLAQLQARRNWICEQHFTEWLDFLSGRWVQFWGKAIRALHAAGLKGVINSAWTKGCFDAFYEYAIDYRRMAALGIDAMVVETVAAGMMQSRPDSVWYHDSYAAALAEIQAACPKLKLIMLHGIKDVDEFWDNLRHSPPAYERELYKLANMFVRRHDGRLTRAASGLLSCLADGISAEEWTFIRARWEAAFAALPLQAGRFAAVFFDAQVDAGVADYRRDGLMPALDQVATLMQHGLPVESFVRWEDVAQEPLPLLIAGAHLCDRGELESLLAARTTPVVLSGRAAALAGFDGYTITDGGFSVVIVNAGIHGREEFAAPVAPQAAPDMRTVYFSFRRYRQPVAEALWTRAAEKLNAVGGGAQIVKADMPCSLLTKSFADGSMEIAIENRATWGRPRVTVNMPHPIAEAKIVSTFPPRVMRCSQDEFTVPVPPRGVCAVNIGFARDDF